MKTFDYTGRDCVYVISVPGYKRKTNLRNVLIRLFSFSLNTFAFCSWQKGIRIEDRDYY